jgi:nitroreductase
MATHLTSEFDVLHAIYHRRAVRAYQPRQPAEELIRKLLAAAVQAPTAMHLEPWGFIVIQDRALLKRYSDRAKSLLLESIFTVGWGSAAFGKLDHPAMLSDPAFNIFYDAGTLIVICRRTGGPFAEADCWLAAENLMLAATAKGLATCPIGFAVKLLNEPDIKRELGIPDDGAAVAPIILGTPHAALPPVSRKPPEVLRWLK